jgi:formylglycine-generating enzyme required for sulfatase activity/outer membrane protein assembly factor BamD (BamD/ComL family)
MTFAFIRTLVILIALPFLAGIAMAADGQKPNRTALVIGNEDYVGVPPAASAKADAEVVGSILTESQFYVLRGVNTSSDELRKKWNNVFLPAIAPGDEAIFYFSGQGVRVGDDNYLLPTDVRADNEEQVKTSGLSLKTMLEAMQQQKPRLFVVILDASRKTSVSAQGLASAKPTEGEVVMYAAAPGKTSLERLSEDDPRTRGLFSRVLLRELGRPGVALPEMLKAVQDKVAALAQSAGQEQLPAIFGQAPSEFRLRPAGSADLGLRIAEDEERLAWENADKQHNETAYKRFLKAFPNGTLAAKAKDRLNDLASWDLAKNGDMEPLKKYVAAYPEGLFIQKARSLKDEGDLWDKARGTSDLALVKDYLARYPQGRFLDPAQTLFARLDAEAAVKREEDAWKTAQQVGTITSYEDYLKAYPQGRFSAPAKETIEKISWDTAQKANSEVSFEQYLKTYPQGRFSASAKEGIEQIAWDKAQRGNSEAAFGAYLKAYPQGRFATSATDKIEQIVWDKARNGRTLVLTRLYLQRYPQGKFSTQARDQEEDIQWDEVRQCNVNDQSSDAFRCDGLVEAFVQRYGTGRHAVPAKALQQTLIASRPEREERKALSDALATGETTSMQAFLDRFPSGKHYAEAMEKLAGLWQKKAPLPADGTPFQDDFSDGSGKGPEMVALPGGKFIMGSQDAFPEKPPHTVVIVHPYAIGKYELTFDDWDACLADKGRNGCTTRPDDEASVLMFRWKGRGRQPIINVVWSEVQQYLTWLSAKTGKKYRLLTEAEWEYAARAGTASQYNFGDNGDQLIKYGWYYGNSDRQAHPVGQLAPSKNGLYDLYGNVAEWVQDCWHSSYEGAPVNGNAAWTTNCVGEAHVTRGGYFYDTASNTRSSSRGRLGNTMRTPTTGFRLARDYP